MKRIIDYLISKSFSRPSSVRDALHYLYNKKELTVFSSTSDNELVSFVSDSLRINPTRLLLNVGYLLGLECKTQLELPNEELIIRCGLSQDILVNNLILPQAYRDSFSLVVASPLAINLDDWFESRVPFYLSTSNLIRAKWLEYYDKEHSGTLRWDVALKELKNLINEAKSAEARGLIFCESRCEIQFIGGVRPRFINPDIYELSKSLLRISKQIELTIGDIVEEKIFIQSASDDNNKHIAITWGHENYHPYSISALCAGLEYLDSDNAL